jgi:hypothetical protein
MTNPVIISFDDDTIYLHANGNCPRTVMAAIWEVHKHRVEAQNSPDPRVRACARRLRALEAELYQELGL